MTSEQNELAKEQRIWGRLAAKRQAASRTTIEGDIEELLDLGFSKRMVADLLNVNITEIMRWQTAEAYLPEERSRTTRLLAFCDLLRGRFGVQDPAGWFETWIVPTCVINPQELYYNGRLGLVLDFVSGRKTPEETLDVYDPQWREVPPSMWEVATNPEGERFIHIKGDGDG